MKAKIFLSVAFCLAVAIPLHAQWTKTIGPDSVRALATGNTIYAGDVQVHGVLAGNSGGGFLSTNSGTSWTSGNGGLSNPITSVTVAFRYLVAGTSGGGIFRSSTVATIGTGGPLVWVPANTGLSNMYVTALANIGPIIGNLIAGTDSSGVFLSTDISSTSGVNWSAINTGLTNKSIRSLAVSGKNFFAGTNGGGVFRSRDSGAHWTAVNTGLANMNVYAIAISGANVFAGTNGGGVFRSTDSGVSWASASAGLKNSNIHALAYSMNLFAATDSGVFMLTNSGTSWAAVNTGFTNFHIRALAVQSPYLFAGVDNGTWRRPLSELTTSVEKFSTTPSSHFTFDPNGSISFSLPAKSFVSLKAFGLSGKKVSVLLSEEISAGTNVRHITPIALPNGLYFLRLQTASFTETKKILLSR